MSRLGPTSLTQLLTDIKTWILSKLDNYVTTNTAQTITGKKLFTASSIQLDNVTSMSGSTMLINTSAAAPRGEFPAEEHRVGRIYIGDNTSYNGAWFIVDPTISTNRAFYRMVTTNPDNTDSARFTIEWNGTKEGVRRRRNISMGDLICATNNTYNIGEPGNVWKEAYINSIHGTSDYTNFLVKVLNSTTTLTHAVSGKRTIVCEGAITLTLPAPEEGSWFHIKATTGSVILNFASGVSVSGVDGIPITLKPNESILLCYYTASSYVAFCNFKRCGVVGRTGNAPSEPNNWFKVAECTLTETYIDPFICLRVFESTTGNTIGTLCAHCRINNTVGVVDTSNCYLQWQDAGSGIDLSKYALTTNETSGTSVTITIWCTLVGGYSSLKFEVVTECKRNDYPNNNTWEITRERKADGDLAELLDTDFTKIVYSTLTTLKNDTTGNAKNVTGTVAIANGGTGATTRLNAVKALTNESVGTPTHFLAITTNWGKAGYTTVAQAKTVLGITGDMGSHSDSEYVHMSGDETIGGSKTFSNNIVINGTYLGTEASINERTNIRLLANRDTADASGAYINRFRQNRTQGAMQSSDVSFVSFDFLENSTRYTRCFTMGLTAWDSDGVPQTYYLTSPGGKGSLGTASNLWNKVYANSYYLGTTSFTDKFVTTDTAQTITGVKTLNSDTLVSDQGNAYRIANRAGTGYGVFQRTDGTNWYMLVTANDDPLGTWTSARPITIRLSDGYCTINGKADEANKVQATIAAGTTAALVQGTIASNDCFRIAAGGAANAGWAEIATGDDANEPIYVRQYKGSFTTLQRTATLLDGSGNTSFPGTVTATGFSGPLTGDVTGNASTATEFSANKDVTLTGDVTGTASSKAGWSVSTTLSNSGVTAGTYGPSADVTGSNNATILVPEITVDAKGRVTAVTNRTYTSVNTDSDKKVYQYYKSDNNVYRLLFSNNSGNTATSNVGAVYSGLNNSFYVNPSTGSLYATKLYSGGTEVSVSGHTHTVSDITDLSSLGLDTVLQTKATDSTKYPILLGATANNSNTITDSTKFNTSLKANPAYGLISLTNTYDDDVGKGVTPSSDATQGTVAMYTQDTGDECAALRAYAYANGTRGMFMRVYNWTNGTDVSPSGTANSCSLGVYVDKTGKAYCKASTAIWANNFIPQSDGVGLIGVGGQRWDAVYAKSIHADTISGDRSCKLKLNLTSWSTDTFSHTISGVPLAPIHIMGSITFRTRPFTVTLVFSGVLNSSGNAGITITLAVTAPSGGDLTQNFYVQGFVTNDSGSVSLQITRSSTEGNKQPTAFTLKVYQ